MEDDKRWWVYILQSETTGLTYTGVTTNLKRRLRQHNGDLVGGARSTFRGRPWKVLHVEGPLEKRAALQREYAIKGMSREQKLALTPREVCEPLAKRDA